MKKFLKYSIIFFIGLLTAKFDYNIAIPLAIIFFVRIRHKLLILSRKLRGKIFDSQDAMFKENIYNIDIYAEYGVGESTIWVFNNTKAKIISVDTSQVWLEKIKTNLAVDSSRVNLGWVDLGDLSNWGKPTSYEKKENIINYLEYIWQYPLTPKLILIDGRFRVACFFTCLLRAEIGTRIIFDDYVNRPYYHIVEELVLPVETFSRQALFIVPDQLDEEKVKKYLDRFLFVMD